MEKRFYWLYVTVFINIIGLGMIFPIMPLFAKAHSASSFQVGLLFAVVALTQFLVSPLLGRISDKYGRKPVLIFSIASNTLSFLVTGFAPGLGIIFFGMVLQGIGTAGVLPVALAYIADVTGKSDKRSAYIARVTGTFALGFTVGPVVGGFLGGISLVVPFILATIVGVLNLILILLFLPETLTLRDKSISVKEGLVDIRPLINALKGEFGVIFFLLFTWAFYISNFILTIPLFTQEKFGFGSFQVGMLFSLTGTVSAITQWIILPKIEEKIKDLKTIILGSTLLIIGLLLTPAFPILNLFVALSVLNVIGSSLLRPSLNSYLSKRTTSGQGVIMGLAFSFESLGRAFGPLMLGFVIGQFGTGSSFLVTAAFAMASLILFYKVEYKRIR